VLSFRRAVAGTGSSAAFQYRRRVSIESALTNRYALWHTLLVADFGYEENEPPRPPLSNTELAMRAVRRGFADAPAIAIDIWESWAPGTDPALGLDLDGCLLWGSSWHAQIEPMNGALGAERLDVDRRKAPELWVHRHPLGHPNGVRLPAAPLMHPDAWVQHVEQVILDRYP
jgi:hypothetical protein